MQTDLGGNTRRDLAWLYSKFINAMRGFVFVTGGIAAVLAIIVTWQAWRGEWLSPIRNLAVTGNAFAEKILPGVLEKFEEKGLAPEGTLRVWTQTIAKEFYETNSPIQLSEQGETVLHGSGIDKMIDANLEYFIEKVENQKPATIFNVEKAAFYILVKEGRGDSDRVIPIKSYLLNYPNLTVSHVAYVGSLYLRDKYFEEYPDILKTVGIY